MYNSIFGINYFDKVLSQNALLDLNRGKPWLRENKIIAM